MDIKIVHLLTHPTEYREMKSISSLSKLDIPYVQHINKVFKGKVPKNSKKWSGDEELKKNLEKYQYSEQGAYGCYSAHKKAILNEFDTDYLMVCECDCIISVPPKQFVDILPFYIKDMEENNIACLGIGSFCLDITKETEELYICENIICTQCMLYSSKHKEAILELFQNEDWCAYDFWINKFFGKKNKLAVVKQRITQQHTGQSLIDLGLTKRMSKRIDAHNSFCFYVWESHKNS